MSQACWIDMGAGQQPLECRLVGVSKSGARLTCDEPDKVATEFALYFTRSGSVGRKCLVVERERNEIALTFTAKIATQASWAWQDRPVIEV